MATIQEKASKKIGDAYFGEGTVIGDGELLKKLVEFFLGLIGGCPLGARRAHRLANGNVIQQKQARRRTWWAAYDMTNDADQADKITEVGMTVAQSSSEKDFADFAG